MPYKTAPEAQPEHWDLRILIVVLDRVFPLAIVRFASDWVTLREGSTASEASGRIVGGEEKALSMSELRSIEDDILQIMDAAILLYDPENISEPVCLLEFEDGRLFDIFSSNAVLGREIK
jgi:hypothetical protein